MCKPVSSPPPGVYVSSFHEVFDVLCACIDGLSAVRYSEQCGPTAYIFRGVFNCQCPACGYWYYYDPAKPKGEAKQ